MSIESKQMAHVQLLLSLFTSMEQYEVNLKACTTKHKEMLNEAMQITMQAQACNQEAMKYTLLKTESGDSKKFSIDFEKEKESIYKKRRKGLLCNAFNLFLLIFFLAAFILLVAGQFYAYRRSASHNIGWFLTLFMNLVFLFGWMLLMVVPMKLVTFMQKWIYDYTSDGISKRMMKLQLAKIEKLKNEKSTTPKMNDLEYRITKSSRQANELMKKQKDKMNEISKYKETYRSALSQQYHPAEKRKKIQILCETYLHLPDEYRNFESVYVLKDEMKKSKKTLEETLTDPALEAKIAFIRGQKEKMIVHSMQPAVA